MEEQTLNKSESKYFNTAIRMNKALIELIEKKDFEYITVKEICEKAGVNRSTFYLHYENTRDLLEESVEYMNNHFLTYFSEQDRGKSIDYRIQNDSKGDLMFISDEYLLPYLKYVRDNRRLYLTVIEKAKTLDMEKNYDRFFVNIISPIMDKFKIQENEKEYILSFYIQGIIGIVCQWLKEDCSMSDQQIADIIKKCILKDWTKAII